MEENAVWFTIDRGVAQGSPLSPCLYNIFMDPFAEALDKAPQPTTREPCKLFADNVKLLAMTAGGLQHSLDLASTWAMEKYSYVRLSIDRCTATYV